MIHLSNRPRGVARSGFTLVELLVVIGIIALLIAILLPTLNRARAAAKSTVELSQLRQMEVAHTLYMNDNKFLFVQPGLGHGFSPTASITTNEDTGPGHHNEQGAWIGTLQPYYEDELVHRSPVDDSPHWEGGEPVGYLGSEPVWRRTSYGINTYTTGLFTDQNGRAKYQRVTQIPNASQTIHFLLMSRTGIFAAADHPHAETWGVPGFSDAALSNAAREMWVNAHGGERDEWEAKSAYGFLDGHAEIRTFRQAWNGTIFVPGTDDALPQYIFINAFDPETAERVQ